MTTSQLVLLGLAGILGYFAYQAFTEARAAHAAWTRGLGATETGIGELVAMAGAASAELGAGSFRRVVTLQGTVEPAGEGDLRPAPLSGADCLWFRVRRIRRFRGDKGRTENEVVSDRRGGGRFELRSGDGAVVTVDPADARVELPVAEQRDEGPDPDEGIALGPVRLGNRTEGYELTEWRLEPGERITVIGEARCVADGVRVAGGPDQPLTLTTSARTDHLDAERNRSRTAIRRAAAFAVGALAVLVWWFVS
ncbi:GIDE domain-containing protein [Pseudonocardia nematodicida]|uniref:RING-type E3 ubiquitin transferase n=1 Tax=Pseudonocardia nematodicida TaxID=1206997 RepID=A0ABV1KD41_9PSEU